MIVSSTFILFCQNYLLFDGCKIFVQLLAVSVFKLAMGITLGYIKSFDFESNHMPI